jgi:acetoin utilization protein AcuB
MMQVQSIMTKRVVSVELDDSLAVVKQIFEAKKFHHLLVLDADRKLCGVISDRDLLRAVSPFIGSLSEHERDLATLHKRVHQIMTRAPVTLGPEASIEEAVRILLEKRVSCVPVVDAAFRPLGILSWRDVLKHCSGPRPG